MQADYRMSPSQASRPVFSLRQFLLFIGLLGATVGALMNFAEPRSNTFLWTLVACGAFGGAAGALGDNTLRGMLLGLYGFGLALLLIFFLPLIVEVVSVFSAVFGLLCVTTVAVSWMAGIYAIARLVGKPK